MAIDLNNALKISASGMKAQGTRLRVISENIANQDSVGRSQGADPYRRKRSYSKIFWTVSLALIWCKYLKSGETAAIL